MRYCLSESLKKKVKLIDYDAFKKIILQNFNRLNDFDINEFSDFNQIYSDDILNLTPISPELQKEINDWFEEEAQELVEEGWDNYFSDDYRYYEDDAIKIAINDMFEDALREEYNDAYSSSLEDDQNIEKL